MKFGSPIKDDFLKSLLYCFRLSTYSRKYIFILCLNWMPVLAVVGFHTMYFQVHAVLLLESQNCLVEYSTQFSSGFKLVHARFSNHRETQCFLHVIKWPNNCFELICVPNYSAFGLCKWSSTFHRIIHGSMKVSDPSLTKVGLVHSLGNVSLYEEEWASGREYSSQNGQSFM